MWRSLSGESYTKKAFSVMMLNPIIRLNMSPFNINNRVKGNRDDKSGYFFW